MSLPAALVVALLGVGQAPGLRHAALVDQTVVGHAGGRSDAVEQFILQALRARGLAVVDAAQTRSLRTGLDVRAIVDGQRPALTTADADVLIAGQVEGRLLQPMGLAIHGCQLEGRVRAVAVDTGEVLELASASVLERDLTPEGAVRRASESLGRQLVGGLGAWLDRSERRFVLSVESPGPVDVRLIDKVRLAVEALPGVAGARLRHAGDQSFELDLEARELTTRAIALALAEDPRSGLRVWGYSDRALRARFEPSKLIGVRAYGTAFVPAGGAPAWSAELVPRHLLVALGQLGFVQADPEGLVPHERGRVAPETLAARGADPARTLVVGGRVRRVGDREVVEARVALASNGRVLRTEARTCGDAELGECLRALGEALGAGLFDALARELPSLGPAPRPARPLALRSAEPSELFPARWIGRTDAGPQVVLENEGATPVTDVSVEVELPGFSSAPVQVDVGTIEPRARRSLRAPLILDRARLATHDHHASAALSVHVRYRSGEFQLEDHFRRPVTVHHRSAIDWSDPDAVGAFVSSTSDTVQAVARRALQRLPAGAEGQALALPVALFEALKGLRYVADPLSPYGAGRLDYLQLPEETLARGSGDCDDLAVLFAALGEAVGVPMLLVTTPGHIFAAVPTALPARRGSTPGALPLIPHDGRWWVPIETTRLDGDLETAWRAGAAQAREAALRGQLGLVAVRDVWTRQPPSGLGPRVALGAAEAVQADLQPSLARAEAELVRTQAEQLIGAPAGADAWNTRGVWLVAAGRDDDARQAFARAAEGRGRARFAALTNLGNLELLAGRPDAALELYVRAGAVGTTPAALRRELTFNRLLAAWALAPEGPRFVDLLLDATPTEVEAFHARLDRGGLRSRTPGAVEDRGGWRTILSWL